MEMAKKSLVIATHDNGVIAVFDDKENITELDPKADTFIHEIEIGDLDGDGKKEFFATPSARNSSKHSQGGSVVMYKWDGKSYVRSVVVAMDKTHAKEILVADLDKNGRRDELYVVNEAVKIGSAIITPVQIVRYTKGRRSSRTQGHSFHSRCPNTIFGFRRFQWRWNTGFGCGFHEGRTLVSLSVMRKISGLRVLSMRSLQDLNTARMEPIWMVMVHLSSMLLQMISAH